MKHPDRPSASARRATGQARSAMRRALRTVALCAVAGAAQFTHMAPARADAFTTPGTYTYQVPAGVTKVRVQVVGGGGGMGGPDSGNGVAGGRGHVLSATLNVTPGQTITGTVGAGGLKGAKGTAAAGGAGGTGTGAGGNGGKSGASGSSGSGGGGGGGSSLALGGTVILKAGGGGGGQGAALNATNLAGGDASTLSSAADCSASGVGGIGANFSGDGGGGGGGGGGYAGGAGGTGHADGVSGGTASGAGTSCRSSNAAFFAVAPTATSGTQASGAVVTNGPSGRVTIEPLTSLTKAFGAASMTQGAMLSLTFSLTNPSGTSAQTGLAFTDTLPNGLVLASPPTSAQCGGTVNGTTGGSTLSFSGGSLAAGPASCTVTALVTTAASQVPVSCPNTRTTNGPTHMSGLSSNLVNDVTDQCVSVVAATSMLTLQKVLGGAGRISASDQFTLSATGPGAPAAVNTTGSGVSVTSAPLSFSATPGSAYTLNEAMAPGSASALSAYSQWVSCGNAGGPTDVSGITALPINITPATGDNISCTITNISPEPGGGGGGGTVGPPPVCNADPVGGGSNLDDGAWTKTGWDQTSANSVVLQTDGGSASMSQTLSGVTPGAVVTFTWQYRHAVSATVPGGNAATVKLLYNGVVYWEAVTPNGGGTATTSTPRNGAACVSGCDPSLAEFTPRTVKIRLPAGIPRNGTLRFEAQEAPAASDDIWLFTPVTIRNTGICLAKTSLGATGTFNFTTSGVDTTMGGGGTTASVTTAAVNTTRYYDASATRANNQPLLITSPGATANVTIGETLPPNFVLESVSCPGLSPVRSGNTISIANVPLDTVTTCTFTNATSSLTLSKALSGNRIAPGDQFTVAVRTGGASGTVVSPTATATTTGSGSTVTTGSGTTGSFNATPGVALTLTEAGASGTDLANYSATLSCTDAAGLTPASALPSNETFDPATGRTITPVSGARLSCTITNAPKAANVTGRVFLDNGLGGGTANDGILNGGEAPLANVAVRLTNCAATPVVHATALTNATGGYSLAVPTGIAAGTAMCVEETNPAGHVSTGASVGGTALPSGSATSVAGTAYTYTRTGTPDRIAFAWNGSGHAHLNFADVGNAAFAANGAKTGLPGGMVSYGHTFTAATAGQVRFSIASEAAVPNIAGWSAQIFADPGCTGSLQPGATQLYPPQGAGIAVATGGQVCVIVRHFIPASAPQGALNKVAVQAAFDHANATPSLSASYTLEDTTTVSSTALELKKEVRNVTQNGSFGINNQAKPGETLEYRITYTNNGDAPITSLTINDTTPNYTTFLSATTGTTPDSLTSCMKRTPANPTPQPAVTCTTTQPTGGTGAIEWKFVGAVNPGGTGTVRFEVKVD